jgi:hypothetical protein
MSADNRYLADFTDIAAIRFECKCGAAVVQPPEKALTEFAMQCFVCQAKFENKDFAESLVREIKALRAQPAQSWRLRLEFNLPC